MKRKWDSRRNKSRHSRTDNGTSTKAKGVIKKMTAGKSRAMEREFLSKVMRGLQAEAPAEYTTLVNNRG